MKKSSLMTIGAFMFAAFTAKAQVSKQIPDNEKAIYVSNKERRSAIAEIGINGGLDFEPHVFYGQPSPIWFGKSQRKKHTSSVSRDRRMKKRKSNR